MLILGGNLTNPDLEGCRVTDNRGKVISPLVPPQSFQDASPKEKPQHHYDQFMILKS